MQPNQELLRGLYADCRVLGVSNGTRTARRAEWAPRHQHQRHQAGCFHPAAVDRRRWYINFLIGREKQATGLQPVLGNHDIWRKTL